MRDGKIMENNTWYKTQGLARDISKGLFRDGSWKTILFFVLIFRISACGIQVKGEYPTPNCLLKNIKHESTSIPSFLMSFKNMEFNYVCKSTKEQEEGICQVLHGDLNLKK